MSINGKDVIRYKLTKEVIQEVEKLLEEKLSYRQIRNKTGVNICTISQIKNNKYKFNNDESWIKRKFKKFK
ncbi:MAG: Trp family transcriptional regulator [Cetobacterium sp.]|uniref:Trp family transcriptional regulator n=1 Tax=Cetobacterium sp. TaxID=2071632 RepID=UPI003F2E5CA0